MNMRICIFIISCFILTETFGQGFYNRYSYRSKRRAAYPTQEEQFDMQYWDKKNGTTTWVDAIEKVKSDNPKP